MEDALAENFRDDSVPKEEPDVIEEECSVPIAKKPRTSEDFYLFCKFILEYENYGHTKKEEIHEKTEDDSLNIIETHEATQNEYNKLREPPFIETKDQELSTCLNGSRSEGNGLLHLGDSDLSNHDMEVNAGLSSEPKSNDLLSVAVKSPITEDEFEVEESSDEDSYDLVTCFCKKPFAGRPMIECSKCLTWIHLSCAKVRKSHIPDVYICPSCKDPTPL